MTGLRRRPLSLQSWIPCLLAVSLSSGCAGLDPLGSPSNSNLDDGAVCPDDRPVPLHLEIAVGEGELKPGVGPSCHAVDDVVALEAVPATGYRFDGWSGDACETNLETLCEAPASDVAPMPSLLAAPVRALVMDRPRALQARFEPLPASDDPPSFFAPWPAGRPGVILQGPNGTFSHGGRHAWDIPMPVGTPILAAADGQVADLRESIPRPDPDRVATEGPANYVKIRHAPDLFSYYLHLDFQGVLVETGQWVKRGQFIAYSGNTGFSTQPHLHYEILDADGNSVVTRLHESDQPDGVPRQGDVLMSSNQLRPPDSEDSSTEGPLARIAPPARRVVYHGDGLELDGTASRSPLGRPLTYQWVQVCGPPAVIDDPHAARPRIELVFGPGLERIAFQLVTHDGRSHGPPAQVDFTLVDSVYVDHMTIRDQPPEDTPAWREMLETSSAERNHDPEGEMFSVRVESFPDHRDSGDALTRLRTRETAPTVSLAADAWEMIVDIYNIDRGDRSDMILSDPEGREAFHGFIASHLEFNERRRLVFRRRPDRSWLAGTWTAVFFHNGVQTASTTFQVVNESGKGV